MNTKVISFVGLVILLGGCENIPGSKTQETSTSPQTGKSFIPPEPSNAITVISAAAKGSMGYEGKRAHLNIKNNTAKDVVMVEFTIQYFDVQSNVLPGSPMHYVETVMPVFLKASETKEFDIPKNLPTKASRIEVAITKVSYAQ